MERNSVHFGEGGRRIVFIPGPALPACRVLWTVIALFVSTVVNRASEAALLNLQSTLPDISVNAVSVKYTASLDDFHAWGAAATLDLDGLPPIDYNISYGNFDIRVTVDNLTGAVTGGHLKISGNVPGLSISGTSLPYLLEGDLVMDEPGFGYQGGGGSLFEFRFNGLSGALASHFHGQVGVKLNAGTINFDGNFDQDFSNIFRGVGSGTADVYPEVPEPVSVMTWSLLGVGLIAVRRRSHRRKDRRKTARNAVGSNLSLGAKAQLDFEANAPCGI